MILFFILYIIFILALLLVFILLISALKIDVRKFNLTNEYQKIIYDYEIVLGVYVFNKVPMLRLLINPQKLKEQKYKKLFSKINLINKKNELDIEIFNNKISFTKFLRLILKELNFEFTKFYLDIKIGTKDCVITSFVVFGVSAAISFLLAKTIKRNNSEFHKYVVTPIYGENNILKVKFNCIINLKMVHIINIIYIYLKQERRNRNERTSNRRSYGYSHE